MPVNPVVFRTMTCGGQRGRGRTFIVLQEALTVQISKKQAAGALGLTAIVVFWFALGGILSASVVVVVIVLAVLILNNAQRKSAAPKQP
jgi:hypothetical protein